MTARALRLRRLLLVAAAAAALVAPLPASAQDQPRFLTREDILLYGIGLKVEPARQTVPKDIATIVGTFLQAPALPDGLPPFAPDAEVRATLSGPSFQTPQELRIRPNTPFTIPPLTVPGIHTLENIRLVSGGEVLLRGVPEQATIEVIERLLVTQVTARPLTAAEIRERGIVFDQSSFQAYNFSAAFAIEDRTVDLSFPVVLPQVGGARDVEVGTASLPALSPPALPTLRTIIPDTLKLQTQIPNLSVVGFTLSVPPLTGQSFVVPPIPGVIVIPGDIGFLNQFFSVMLMVGNVAPEGSGLVVSDLTAEIVLPPGRDTVVGTDDDPLRMARTAGGETPRVQLVVQPGPDGRLGTADDLGTLGPGETGNAEYLVEGRREGSHVVEMAIAGTLHGLPVGPVPITGRAAGSVLVRNPTFTLTFTHPEVVTAGEAYTLDVTVTNTSESPANFVQLTLYPRNVSGATILGESSRDIESIPPGDAATVTFDLVSRKTGKVTAATLDSDGQAAGRFELKAAVGELGVPLSPDSLVLPKEAGSLPRELRDAALGLLGKAWAVATAPAAALPRDVRRFSRKIVIDRAVEVAEAGLRHTLGEPLADTAAQLAMDFAGSNVARLADLVTPEDLAFERDDYEGFDELRRHSVRGDAFAAAAAALLRDALEVQGPAVFHAGLAERWSYRPPHLAVLVSSPGPLPVSIAILDAQGRRVGGLSPEGKVLKEIPFSDVWPFARDDGTALGALAMLAAPEPGPFTVRLEPTGASAASFTISVVLPAADGSLRQIVFDNLTAGQRPVASFDPNDPYTIEFEVAGGVTGDAPPSIARPIADPAPSVVSVIQQADADLIRCDDESPAYRPGRVVAVLFSEEVTAASVQDRAAAEAITSFLPEANRAISVALQPGRRIAFVALRDPIGPFVSRSITIEHVADLRGQPMLPFTGPMEPTVGPEAGVVSGQVRRADGTPIPYANVRLFYWLQCGDSAAWVGIASKSADADGRYAWDYVLRTLPDKIVAVDVETDEFRGVPFNIQRDGQRLNVDIMFLGRGTLTGTTRSEAGALLADTVVRVTSLTDASQYGARTDADGRFSIARVPVGNVFVEAVNTTAHAEFAFSDRIPFAGATVDRDITLLDVEQRKTTVDHGTVRGHVLGSDGATPAPGVPVFIWYAHNSQPGVRCPGNPPPFECAVAGGETDAQGAFEFVDVPAGSLRVSTFDQDGLMQGEARLELAADATRELNVLLVGGLGTVAGRVVDADGAPVAGATVGGGLSLTTTNGNGEFTLVDVPVGRREIVAVSELHGAAGRVTIDLVRAGETVNALIVLDSVGSVSGTVVEADGVTPAANVSVYVFARQGDGVNVVGYGTTDTQGGYRIDGIGPGSYTVSAFNDTLTDGNVAPVVIRYNRQVFRADIRWRGSGGRVVGTVFDDDGQTPLKALVSLSGDQVLVAGGRVGTGFQWVNHFRVAETDLTTGRFTLTGAWVGPVTVSAAGQFSPDPVAVGAEIPSPNATVEVNLQLQPTSQIQGVVLQPDDVHPVGQNVIVRYKSEAFRVICTTSAVTGEESCDSIPQGIQEETVVTDDTGRFWLPVVNAGAFTITVEDPVTGKFGELKGSVRAGETADVTVRLLGQGELAVRVVGSDTVTAIPGARVLVRQLNGPRKIVEGVADTQGEIAFVGADGFTEGDLVIEATDLRNGFSGRGSARITADGEVVSATVYLYDAVGAVYGRVSAPDGLTPVPNAEIVVSNAAGPIAFALSGVDGSYRVELMPLGPFTVEAFEARTARRASGAGGIDLAGQEVPVNLTQAAIGVVKGRVLDASGLVPLKGWTVTLGQTSVSGQSLGTLQTTTAIDGSFLFPGTSRGTFTLAARRTGVAGGAGASGTITREGEQVDVPLVVTILRPLAGTIAGTVLTPLGAPAPDTAVEICHEGRSCDVPVALTAGPDGTFELPDVPLGRFTVTARSQVTHEAGTAVGELTFDGDIASVQVVLGGLAEVRGTVERANQTPADGVRVELVGVPDTGCPGDSCVVFTDANGAFAFVDVPARSFTVTAVDPLNPSSKGAAGGALNPGEVKQVRIVLAPAFTVSGRVLLPGDRPAAGMVAEIAVDPERHLFAESGADGTFAFAAVPPGTWLLSVSDPIGSGVASRSFTVTSDLDLGDVRLDTAPPVVASSSPAGAATGVPRDQVISVRFSEAIRPGTVNPDNVSLSGPAGPVTALLDVSDGDTMVTITPLGPLADETRYTVRVRGVEDRVGKAMPAEFVATFTTVDITPPAVADASPAAATAGVPIYSPIRIRFSEAIDPSRFAGAPIALAGPAGPVAGRTDYLFGNTVIVFTPNLPLAEDAVYAVSVARATDLEGNQQPQAFDYQFRTTDRTPPQILALTAANGGTVVENGTTSVTADVGVTHDVAVVDWYINGVLSFADRSEPFALSFKALPEYGAPGSQIHVSAIATDTSGNRGGPAAVDVLVTADQPPVLVILSPATGASAANGDRIVVDVRATDDLGVTQVGYRADTGRTTDALTRTVSPASTDRTESFVFYVPADAAPGSTILVHASGADTYGHVTSATASLVVTDATPPVVTITGATSGARLTPGQQTTVVVTAQDAGGIAEVRFTASGLVTASETRPVSPAQASIVTSFSVTVPVTAQPGQTLTLGAVATDAAGNAASAAQVVLTVADTGPPTVTLAPQSGSSTAVPGASVFVVATASDEIAVSRVDLSTSGAVTFSDARQVSPPSGSAAIVFEIPVPASAAPGTQIFVRATAIDLSGNVSLPAQLTLDVVSAVDVTMPASEILRAGSALELTVEIAPAAPAGGLRVDFTSADPNVATVAPFVTIPEGETSAAVVVTAVSGGSTQVRAAVQGVPRAATTVTVVGGIVHGTVRDSDLVPVAGVQLTVFGGAVPVTAVTDGAGAYEVEGVYGPAVDVRAIDPVTRLYGRATGLMTRAGGEVTVNVVLIPAAAVSGTVYLADATTPAGGGVRVDIRTSAYESPLATTFTNDAGFYEFPLVTLGDYLVEASAVNGSRGRASAPLHVTGQQATIDVIYLGAGSVSGTVRQNGVPVANAELTFQSWSIFGSAPAIVQNAEPDGTFAFTGVPVGSFSIVARDIATGQAGSASGAIDSHGQSVAVDVALASFGALEGRVLAADGATIVAGAAVSIRGAVSRQATTDADGRFRFDILPLGSYSIDASEPGTHAVGSALATLVAHGATVTQDVTLLPQGRLLVTVTDAGGAPRAGAYVAVTATFGTHRSGLWGTTGPDGTVLVDHVLAGTFTVNAVLGSLRGSATGALAAGELQAVTVALQPTGSLAGVVLEADGQTPAAGARVVVYNSTPSSTAGSDGAYRIDGLALGSYDVVVYDAAGRLRARTNPFVPADNLVLAANADVAVRDFTLIGLGTVTGRVLNPDGSSAQDVAVQVAAHAAGLETTRSARTNAGGYYTVADVAVGSVTVTAGDLSRQLYGERSDTLVRHGDTLQVDISLTSNAIALPRNLHDANNFLFDVASRGSVDSGTASLLAGDLGADRGGFLLDVTAGGVTTRFSGGEIPTIEDGNREIVVRQENLAGLSVTRKVMVPLGGYFARYLEILRNPTAAPITVDLDVVSFPQGTGLGFVATSTGDLALTVGDPATADHWAVLGRSDAYGLAFVLDGPGAAAPAAAASFGSRVSDTSEYAQIAYGWRQITIEPGATVVFLHFGVQQFTRAAATAAAERLVGLPPEALAGLSPEELAAIRNFVVPADGVSALAPLPSLTASVTGRVYEFDAATPVPSAVVRVTTDHPLFRRTLQATATPQGVYTLSGQLVDGASIALPAADFSVDATHPSTGVVGPVTAGGFDPGTTTAARDLAFTNTGVLAGLVRRHTGAAVTGGTIALQMTGDSLRYFSIASDASYRIGGVRPGAVQLTATTSHPQGTGLTAVVTGVVTAGQALDLPIVMPATGTVAGVVRSGGGALASGVTVRLDTGSFWRSVQTDSGGAFTLVDVPAGTYTLTATEPLSQRRTTLAVAVGADQTTTVDLQLVALASVVVELTYANGAAAAGAPVQISYLGNAGTVDRSATTDAAGRATFPNVPEGTFAVKAWHPSSGEVSVTASGAVVSDGQVVPIAIALPAVGAVQATVVRASGVAAAGSAVSLEQPGRTTRTLTTDATGVVTFTGAQQGAFTLRAAHPANANLTATATGAIVAEGETATVLLTLPAIGRVTGVATMPDGSLVADLPVSLRVASGVVSPLSATTDGSGVYAIDGVPAGPFSVTAEDPVRGVFGTASGQIVVDGATVTVNLPLQTNVIGLPAYLFDANGFQFDIQSNGSLSDGSSDAYDGGLNLRLVVGGIQHSFSGSATALVEEAGREVVIRRNGLGGLDVVRKIFVPADGYFGRYLEVLTNPGAAPVTVDVQITTNLGSDSGTQVIATSSGDQVFDAGDLWLVTDDYDSSGDPSLAHVMGGQGAARALSSASRSYDDLVYRWNGITIAPGETVVIMHFAAQHFTQAQVRAVAERLVQLPPEAIAGLSAEEIAAITNFAVPADGSSPLPELRQPPAGTVDGHVYSHDGVSPIAYAQVTFVSQNVIFGNRVITTADAQGRYVIANTVTDAFTVEARHPQTSALSGARPGTFEPGQFAATVDIVLASTGAISGAVRLAGGDPVPAAWGAYVDRPYYVSLAADGRFALTGLRPGSYTLRAWVPHPQGTGFTVQATGVMVAAGQTTVQDLVVPPTGAVAGIVRDAAGQPAIGITVWLEWNDGYRETTTSALGGYLLPDVPVGPVTVHAREPLSGVTSSAAADVTAGATSAVDLTLVGVGTVSGLVSNPNGSGAGSAYVVLIDDAGGVSREAYTDATGAYTVTGVAVGRPYTVRAYAPGYYENVYAEAAVQLTVPGSTATVNLTVPARATVRVWVRDAAGQPMYFRGVSLRKSFENYFNWYGYTNGSGYLDIASVPEGPFAVQALVVGSNYTTRYGTVARTDHGAIVEITITPPPAGSVRGAVRAADGVTGIPWSYLELRDADTGVNLQSVYADQNGYYDTGSFNADAFLLRAFTPDGSFVDRTGSITVPGEIVTIDFTLPVSIVRGTVTNADGTPVPYPNVLAKQTGENGLIRTYYTQSNDDLGNYLIVGVPFGDFQVTAQDSNGLTVTVAATMADITVPVTVDVQLPPTLTVQGTFTDAAGVPVAPDLISLTGADGTWTRYFWWSGPYVFDRVPVGAFQLTGCVWREWYVCTTTAGEGTTAGQVVTTNLRLPGEGTLDIRVVSGDGTPVDGFEVRVESPEVDTQGRWFSGANALLTGIPEGTLRVSVVTSNWRAGVADVTLLAGRTQVVEVTVGNAVTLDALLEGADGFLYDVGCDGTIGDGGTTDGALYDAYDTAYRLRLNGAAPPCLYVVRTEDAGRELVLGPFTPEGSDGEGGVIPRPFSVTRKIFSPAAGGFVRYLELVTNTAPVAMPVTVAISGNYGPYATDVALPVTPASTGNTFGVMADTTGSAPAVAHVFGGPGAPLPVASVSLAAGNDNFSYRWSVVLAPGQTVAFLHFGVQRGPADVDGARAQAEALAGLGDPSALEGLSAEERALIANFAGVPGGLPPIEGSVEGHVLAGDGTTPVPGAAVYATDAAGGRLLGTTRTDANGAYRFGRLYLTALGATITAVSPVDPLMSADAPVVFSAPGDALSGVDLVVTVSVVRGTVTLADGVTAVDTPTVLVAPDGGGPSTVRAPVSRSDGFYAFVGLAPGTYALTVIDPGTLASARETVAVNAPDAVVTQDVTLPWNASCAPLGQGLGGWWRFENDAADAVHGAPAATLSGGASFTAGLVGQALWLDGIDGMLSLESPVPRSTETLSIEAWVQFVSLDTPGAPTPGEQQIVLKRRGSPGWVREDYALVKTRRGDGDHFELRVGQPYDSEAVVTSTTTIESGRFYHVVATFDGPTARLYVNGLLEGETFLSGPRDIGSTPIVVGRSNEPSGDAPCACVVDELKVFGRALAAVDVQAGLASGPAGACTDLGIVTDTLPPAYQDQPYAAMVRAVGGVAPVTFWVSGGSLPPGLALAPDGSLSGVPIATGGYSFEVSAADDAGAFARRWLTIECGTCLANPTGIVGFWAADGDARDAVGANDGTTYGPAFAPGVSGQAFSFDGDGSYVGGGSTLDVADTFTIEFWVNPSAERASTSEANWGISGTWSQRYAIAPEYRYTNGIASVGVSVGTNGISVFEHGPSYLPSLLVYDAPIAGWTHVAVVYANKTPSLYVNGALVRTGLTSAQTRVYASRTFGDWWWYGPYAGLLDEIGIYTRALDAAEIAAIAGTTGEARCPIR